MAFQKGGLRVAAKATMQRFNYDPLEVLVQCAQGEGLSNDTKIHIAETLLPYMYPKLSSITVEGELTTTTTVEQQQALIRRVLENPELADAAAKLSLAAADSFIESGEGLSIQ